MVKLVEGSNSRVTSIAYVTRPLCNYMSVILRGHIVCEFLKCGQRKIRSKIKRLKRSPGLRY